MKLNFTNNLQMDLGIGAATAIAAGVSAASSGGQMIWQGKMNKKTRRWNEKMYGIQRQDAIADWNRQNEYNNPEAQKERLKAAGLNPALMYGGGPQPGGITQPVRGSSTGNWSPQVPDMKGMGIEQLMAMSQIKVNEATAKKLEVEAEKTAGVDTEEAQSRIANNKLAGIIAEFTGKELKDVYEQVKVPNRGQEAETYSKEMQARQGVLDVLRDQYENGQLATKANAEVERELLQNAKTREETKNIIKTFDLLEQNIKGQTLENAFKELDLKLQKETGVDRNAAGWQKTFGRLLMLLTGQ